MEISKEEKKAIYSEIGSMLQIEQDMCHANKDYCFEFMGDITPLIPDDPGEAETIITREDGIKVFNRLAESEGLNALQNPIGYMTLDDNVYDYIKDQYTTQYEKAAYGTEHEGMKGSVYALNAVKDNVNKQTRNDMSEALPKGINWSDLRFVRTTDEMANNINAMVASRVSMTINYSLRRQGNNRQLFAEDTEDFNFFRDKVIDNIKQEVGYVEKEEVKVESKNNDFGLTL